MDKLKGILGFGLLAMFLWVSQDALAATSLSSATSAGTQWLQAQVQTDGSVANAAGIATNMQAESEALESLTSLNAAGSAPLSLTLGLVNAETYDNTENLSRKIVANTELGGSSSALLTALLANQGRNGGFGELSGYQSTSFDTAFALKALNAAGQGDSDAAHQAIFYLLNRMATNGSWSDWPGIGTSYSTALVIQALSPYRTQLTSAGSAITAGINYLKSQRQSSTDWGETFINAQVVLALASANAGPSLVTDTA
ncbi:MAG TPA: hypothetical protein VFX47_06995, partial [Gammaproteobacteria bacterium]|nr:hypothetical protein [Gammaproteobacteria bacterium]